MNYYLPRDGLDIEPPLLDPPEGGLYDLPGEEDLVGV